MKKLFISLAATSLILFASCASTSNTTDEANEVTESPEITVTEQIPEDEVQISVFVDWKYKGFGQDLPESAEKVLDLIEIVSGENIIPVKNGIVVDTKGNQFIKGLTLWAAGTDADQSMNTLASSMKENLSRFEQANSDGNKIVKMDLIEDYWVEINSEYKDYEKPYIAIRLYNIELSNDDSLESVDYYKFSNF